MFNGYLRSLFYFNANYDYLAAYLTTWSKILHEEEEEGQKSKPNREQSSNFQLFSVHQVFYLFYHQKSAHKIKVYFVILFLFFKGSTSLYSHFFVKLSKNGNQHDFHSELLAKTNAHLVHTAFCLLAAYHYGSFYLQGEPFINEVLLSAVLERRRKSIFTENRYMVQSLQRFNRRLCYGFQKIGIFINYNILLSIGQNVIKKLLNFEPSLFFFSSLLRQLFWSTLSLLTFYANLNIAAILLCSVILLLGISFTQFAANLQAINRISGRTCLGGVVVLQEHSFTAFHRAVVRSLVLMHHSNAFYGQLFLVNLLVMSPINAQLMLWILFGWGLTTRERAYLSPFAVIQLGTIFGVHYLLTRYSSLFHRSGTACGRLIGRGGTLIGNTRLRLKVAAAVWCLNTSPTKRYGIYYGRAKIAIVTMRTFHKFIFFFFKFLLMNYKLFQMRYR